MTLEGSDLRASPFGMTDFDEGTCCSRLSIEPDVVASKEIGDG